MLHAWHDIPPGALAAILAAMQHYHDVVGKGGPN
jgi:hypothetical protein